MEYDKIPISAKDIFRDQADKTITKLEIANDVLAMLEKENNMYTLAMAGMFLGGTAMINFGIYMVVAIVFFIIFGIAIFKNVSRGRYLAKKYDLPPGTWFKDVKGTQPGKEGQS